MSVEFSSCPVHAPADATILNAWPCPEDCPEFLGELERQIEDVKVHGNFTRMWTDGNGHSWSQLYRAHQPVGEPEQWRRRSSDRGAY